MHIKDIYIDRFGKLKNQSFRFDEGINIIYGNNEAGKSTLENFMLSIFYGSRASRKNNVDVRKQYIPYGEDYAFGNMNIEFEDKEITIERKISGKKKDDFFRAYEKDTFDQVNMSENLGKTLFDVELEEFIKTLYINQNATKFLNEKDEGLSTKLTNILETGDEEISFTKAMDRIDKEMKLIKGIRKNGRLDDIYLELSELYAKLDQARHMEKKSQDLTGKLAALEESHRVMKSRKQDIHQLKDRIHLYEVKNEFLRIRKNLDDLKALKEEKRMRFPSASDEDLKSAREKEIKLTDAEDNLILLRENVEVLKRRQIELDLGLDAYRGFEEIGRDAILNMVRMQGEEMLLEEKLKYFDQSSTMNRNLLERREEMGAVLRTYEKHLLGLKSKKTIVVILSVVTVLISLVYYSLFKEIPLSAVIFILGVLIYPVGRAVEKMRVSHHLKMADRSEETIKVMSRELGMDPEEVIRAKTLIDRMPRNDEKLKLTKRYEEVISHKEHILSLTNTRSIEDLVRNEEDYRVLKEKREEHFKEIRRLEAEVERISEQKNQLLEGYKKLISKLGFDETKHNVYDFLEEYELEVMRMKEHTLREEALKYAIKGLIGDRSEEEVKSELDTLDSLGLSEGLDLKTLEEKERKLGDEEAELLEEISRVRLSLNEMNHQEPLYFEDCILTLQDEETRLKRRYEVLELTRSIMKDSYDKLRKEFSGKLNDRVTQIYNEITGTERSVKVSELFSMSYRETGMLWNDTFLSHGSKEQLYLSLRLAMAELVYEGRKVPLFLDEAFSSYDENRLKSVLKYLKSVSDRYQIFIFTCHKREIDILLNEANILELF
ncbi:AAA family ATPase [Proteiniclasticum sp.]|uniref:ATP-binding protein n=1 Tax=Proteiniclasticum sp. TaxID=2053595 RepID=UPI00289E25A8|nr:AAA family ATPase [Proteiniclasticum sp.]